jgi:hypothetical protein
VFSDMRKFWKDEGLVGVLYSGVCALECSVDVAKCVSEWSRERVGAGCRVRRGESEEVGREEARRGKTRSLSVEVGNIW